MTGATDSQQKYENYKTQFQRLTKALSNDFNLEAIFMRLWRIEQSRFFGMQINGKPI